MASHILSPGMLIKTKPGKEEKILTIQAINLPLLTVKYQNGNFAGVVNISHIKQVKVGEVWENYTP